MWYTHKNKNKNKHKFQKAVKCGTVGNGSIWLRRFWHDDTILFLFRAVLVDLRLGFQGAKHCPCRRRGSSIIPGEEAPDKGVQSSHSSADPAVALYANMNPESQVLLLSSFGYQYDCRHFLVLVVRFTLSLSLLLAFDFNLLLLHCSLLLQYYATN